MVGMQEEIKKVIAKAAGVDINLVKLEHPDVEEFGDYSCNLALVLKGGRSLAEKIVKLIKLDGVIAKVEVAGPGFINIWLQNSLLVKEVERVLDQAQRYGKNSVGHNERVIIDYSAPNIAKPFGIGHLRSTIIGQALYNLHKANGFEVIGDNHLGDWGTQFGKLLFMITKDKIQDLNIETLEEVYVEFHKHPEWEVEGQKWFKKLEEGNTEARALWQKCVDVSRSEFDRVYDLLGVKIDFAFGESFYEDMMQSVIDEAKEKNVAKLSEGAWVIEIPNISTPLMLVKTDGGTTYATRDLATIKFRQEKWDPELVIYEVGAEQGLHFEQVFAAAKLLGYVSPKTRLVHTKHGLYLDTDGKKFSTRKGKTVKLDDVLLEAVEKARKLGTMDELTAKQVGIGAIKYFDLMHGVQSDIVFDWDKILNLQGNSGPYLQYTHARTRSVLAKSHIADRILHINPGYEFNFEEMGVLRYVYRFPEVVEEAAEKFSPNLVCNYLYNLAQRYNSFYNQHSILSADNEAKKVFRLGLTASVGQIIKNGLNLLGIEAPDTM